MRSARGAIPLILVLGLAAPALAQNKKAEALNEEGKDLYSDKKDYVGAAAKFRQAIELSPDPRYYFNLCSALDRLELYDQALEACDGVFAHKPRADLAQKTGAKAAEIRQRMKQGDGEPEPKPPEPAPVKTEPTKPPPAPIKPTDPAVTQPNPTPVNPYRAVNDATAMNDSSTYGWSLGIAVGPVRNNYQNSEFKRTGFDLKIYADFLLAPKLHMGLEPYLHFSVFDQLDLAGRENRPLSFFDFGAAWYWHLRLGSSSFYFTPAAGLSISFLNPQGFDRSYLTAGIRLEAPISWVIANRHVISLGPALTIYPPAAQLNGTSGDESFGLTGTGSTFAVLIGYSYRFDYGWFVGLPLE